MKNLRKDLFVLLLMVLFAISAQAGERRSELVIADFDHGVALVPDGTEFPKGIVIKGRNNVPLVFTHAAEDNFTSARAAIAANAPWGGADRLIMMYEGTQQRRHPRAASERTLRAASDTVSDVWTYVYFIDGSWVGSRRYVDDSPYFGAFGVQTATYTPENDYYNGSLYSEQTSVDHPNFNVSETCSINYAGGSCYTPIYAVGGITSAHVTSFGHIHHHRLPICGRYYEPPCEDNFSASIEVYVP